MGLFTSKKDKLAAKELKEARATLKHLERTKSQKIQSMADPTKAITELQPCKESSAPSSRTSARGGACARAPVRCHAKSC